MCPEALTPEWREWWDVLSKIEICCEVVKLKSKRKQTSCYVDGLRIVSVHLARVRACHVTKIQAISSDDIMLSQGQC